MPEWLIITIVIGWFFLFLAAGQNVGSFLLGAGMIGIILWTGIRPLSGIIEADVFSKVASYTLTAIPLYVVMSQFIMEAGILKDVYSVVYRISGRNRSFLGFLTFVVGGMLGAVSGSATAMAAGLSLMASPQLERYGYSREFSGAIVAAAGSISTIIPPSIILIVCGAITQTSIAKLFLGSIIPGILVILLYTVIFLFMERAFKGTTANTETVSSEIKEIKNGTRLSSSIPSFALLFVLVVIIFGGIYGGIMTPTEAGGVAAFVALLGTLALRKLSYAGIQRAMIQGAKVTSMVLFIMIGAQIFARFVSLSMIPRQLIALLDPLMGHPYIVVGLILAFFFILAMFIEGAAVLMMGMPIVLPIVFALEVDMVWFGVMVSMMMTFGLLTPPVGLCVYAVGGTLGIPMPKVFRYTMVFATVVALIIVPVLMAFPQLITWLPQMMR